MISLGRGLCKVKESSIHYKEDSYNCVQIAIQDLFVEWGEAAYEGAFPHDYWEFLDKEEGRKTLIEFFEWAKSLSKSSTDSVESGNV